MNLEHAPQNLLRTLFEIIRLQIQLHPGSGDVTITVTLPARMITDLTGAVEGIEEAMPPITRQGRTDEPVIRVVADGAPNGSTPRRRPN